MSDNKIKKFLKYHLQNKKLFFMPIPEEQLWHKRSVLALHGSKVASSIDVTFYKCFKPRTTMMLLLLLFTSLILSQYLHVRQFVVLFLNCWSIPFVLSCSDSRGCAAASHLHSREAHVGIFPHLLFLPPILCETPNLQVEINSILSRKREARKTNILPWSDWF